MSFQDHRTLQCVRIVCSTRCVPRLFYEDTYEVDPELCCGFDMKPSSFQILL